MFNSAKDATGLVLVTGASTGIGRSTATHLASLGFRVLAGVRKDLDAQIIEGEARKNGHDIRPLLVDVTDAESIARSALRVREIVGETGLRALVNNAGIVVVGPAEFVSLDDWRRQFEVNLFGQIAMTQAMLPILRQHAVWNKSSGKRNGTTRVVMMSSISGRLSQPMMSPYTASKHALEAVSDSLRLELRRQGIGVSLVEPGAIKSEIWGKGSAEATRYTPESSARVIYGPELDAVTKAATKSMESAIDPIRVAWAVEQCLMKSNPPTRIVVGKDAKLGVLLQQFMPAWAMDLILSKIIGLPR